MLSFKCLINNSVIIRKQIINYESVRWIRPRKPFWLGMAKTKVFAQPKIKKYFTDEEFREYYLLKPQYEEQLKTIINFIKYDNPLNFRETNIVEEQSAAENLKKAMEESLKRNDEWNAESEKLRKKRMEEKFEEVVQKVSHIKEIHQQKTEQEMEKIEEIVRQEKIARMSFVTPNNLDEAIEECLNSVVEYNYAIKMNGQRIEGKESFRQSQVAEFMVDDKVTESVGLSQD